MAPRSRKRVRKSSPRAASMGGSERRLHERTRSRRKREGERRLVPAGAHLLPRLLEDLDGLVLFGVLLEERVELELEENETERVLHRLRIGIRMKVLLDDDTPDGLDDVVRVARAPEHAFGAIGVEAGELRAPLKVPDTSRRKIVARDRPAFDVLAAG